MNNNTSSGGGNLAMNTIMDPINPKNVHCQYQFTTGKNEQVIEVTETFDDFKIERYGDKILSMFSLRHGALVIEPVFYLYTVPRQLQMLDAVFTCGPDKHNYVFYVDASDQIPFSGKRDDFVKSGHEILTSPYQDRSLEPLNRLGPVPHVR